MDAFIMNRIREPYLAAVAIASDFEDSLDEWWNKKHLPPPVRWASIQNITMQWYRFCGVRGRLNSLVAPFGRPPVPVLIIEMMAEDFMEELCQVMCQEGLPHRYFRVPRH